MKQFKGEKYIYLTMAYLLAKQNGGKITIGWDNGFAGGQMFERRFEINAYQNQIILIERKTGAHGADFSKYYWVIEGEARLYVYEYFEGQDNMSKNWIH